MQGQFALVVGTVFERRFPLEIIRSFRLLEDLDIGLVIAGDDRRRKQGSLHDEIRELGLEHRVRWLEYCPEEDLRGLYRSAAMLISLSLYEGFSLPPLEALKFRLPIIVSARGAQLEVYGEAALTIEKETEETVAAAVRRVAEDSSLRAGMIARGRELADRMSLAESAAGTLQLIRTIGSGGSA
jgi:glycosyltransferase involved in cell wall biosynthesis